MVLKTIGGASGRGQRPSRGGTGVMVGISRGESRLVGFMDGVAVGRAMGSGVERLV